MCFEKYLSSTLTENSSRLVPIKTLLNLVPQFKHKGCNIKLWLTFRLNFDGSDLGSVEWQNG